jgi:hypothetical protein
MRSIAMAATLAACSALDPYSTYPPQPDAATHDAGPRVAICSDTLVSPGAAVQKAPQSQCAADTVATRVETDRLLQYCPLLLPARATFVCTPKSKKYAARAGLPAPVVEP